MAFIVEYKKRRPALVECLFDGAPSPPRPALDSGLKARQLLSQLDMGHAPFDDRYDEPNPGVGLRGLLRPYLSDDMPSLRRQVDSLIAATLNPVNCVVPEARPPMVRALECAITFDEDGFDGVSPYALSVASEKYLARHVSVHAYTRIVLYSRQRRRLGEWPPRPGTRGVG